MWISFTKKLVKNDPNNSINQRGIILLSNKKGLKEKYKARLNKKIM